MTLQFTFDPLIGDALMIALWALGMGVILLAIWRRSPGIPLRSLAMLGLLLLLANPSVDREERQDIPDVVTIVTDRSQSQSIGERTSVTDEALEALRDRLARFSNLEVRTIEAGSQTEQSLAASSVDAGLEETGGAADAQNPASGRSDASEGTALFDELRDATVDLDPNRSAGIILLTDGQVHDVPEDTTDLERFGPLHALITGNRDEKDRKLTVEKAPRFGIVGNEVEIDIRVEDFSVDLAETGGRALVRLFVDGQEKLREEVEVGALHSMTYTLDHGGQNVVEIEAEPLSEEITLVNNRAAIVTNGVRDRLRVLLVSGEPHAGERTWRNLLKADPSVDLVHFTILRPPEKQDGTPIGELSLIAFPTRELFSNRLADFDLIVFDRYQQRGVLPVIYLGNIARYVEEGGAVLTAAGPAFASPTSLYRTPLAAILPSKPTGSVIERGYKPMITPVGARHPVTAGLEGANRPYLSTPTEPDWGRWFRFIDTEAVSGTAVMSGPDDRPLLLLDRVGEGRVAQLMSDHAWLWARGYENGGPQGELLRRLAHWLMKEPDLEEEKLLAQTDGTEIEIIRRTMEEEIGTVEVTFPDGSTRDVALEKGGPGEWRTVLSTDQLGLYRLSDGEFTTVAAVGPINPLEFADIRATEERLEPVISATQGGAHWLTSGGSFGLPAFREVGLDQDAARGSWLGLRRNNQFVVESTERISLVNPWIYLLVIGGILLLAWRQEAR